MFEPNRLLAFLALFGFPLSSSCCEPVLPLVKLLSGATLVGPLFLTESFLWLSVAIAIKCGAFVMFERRLAWGSAMSFMVLANVISTVPGLLIAALAGTGTGVGVILALPVIFLLGWIVQRRVALLSPSARHFRVSGGAAMACFVGFFVVSMILYSMADSFLHEQNNATYWVFKFLFVTLVAGMGIIISAVLEECIIARLARKGIGNQTFYTSVFRANYIALGAILLVAAIKILPQRLNSPDFITSWLKSLLSGIGDA
jgi:hypothetical protein